MLGASCSFAAAQTPISGPLFDASTGPLLSGVVYHVTGDISVPGGQTLTIQPGAIVKFGFDRQFVVDGALVVDGAGFDSVIFTDLRDDSAGGDTNGDGSFTVPAGGWWRGVQFTATSSASQVAGLTVRYGGRFIPNFNLSGCDGTFTSCRSELCSSNGWNLSNNSLPTLIDCDARDNLGLAFTNAQLAGVPNFSGLTASGNGRDQLDLASASVPAGTVLTIGPGNLLGGVVLTTVDVQVPVTSTLNIQAGTIVKMGFDRRFLVNGTLNCSGTSGAPVIVTDERDDAAGGDTNGNGSFNVPAAGWWRGIQMNQASGGSLLEHLEVRYGGRFVSALDMQAATPTVRNCLIRDISNDGVDLNLSSSPTIEGLRVENCLGNAIDRAELRAVPNFSGLDFDGNTFDRLAVLSATVLTGESLTITTANLENDVINLRTNIQVQDGATLRLEPGVIVKCAFDVTWVIDGTLELEGAPTDRIVITDERDDTIGGDTNGNGNGDVPVAGWWRGLQFRSTSTNSFARFAELRYGGRFVSAIEVVNCSVSVERSIITDFTNAGVDLNSNTNPCPLLLLEINNCSDSAIRGVRLERLQDIEFARGSGNLRNTVEISDGTLTGDVTVEPENQFNGSIYMNSNITIPAGVEMNLQAGVVMKMRFDGLVTVHGALTVRASLEKPVILTDLRDDSVGGDTNGNGTADVPVAGWWRGVHFRSGSNSLLQGLEVRYGGRFIPGILCDSSATGMRDVRSSHSSAAGMRFSAHLVDLEGLVATDNAGDGVELTGGTFDVRRVTSVNNGGFGIDATAAFTGAVKDSIVRDNGGSINGLATGRVTFSNGFDAGANGNIDADPLFVDAMNGDYRLASELSPSFNAGDPASPLDPDSTRADQGAYFFNICEPSLICTQTQTFGPCAQSISVDGFASLTSPAPCIVRMTGAPTQTFGLFFYGIGAPTTVVLGFGDVCVAAPYVRSTAVFAGGSFADGPCAGTLEFDFNGFLQMGIDPNVVAGSNVIGHLWYRNPSSPAFASFSDGVQLPVCP